MAGFQPGSATNPTANVELSISCNNIMDADVFSKSDPMCVVYLEEFGQTNYVEMGRTECIMNNLNPEFTKKFIVPYMFEQQQKLKFELYDLDSESRNLNDHDFLGRMFCSLGEIINSGSLTRPLVLESGCCGTITVRAEEIAACKEEFTMQFIGNNLDKKNRFLFWRTSSPFLIFSKANEDSTFTVVHRTESVRSDTNPTWRPFAITGLALCNGDPDRLLKVQCHDWQPNGSHKFIGEFYTTLKQLKKGVVEDNAYEVINATKQAKYPTYTNSGSVRLVDFKMNEVFSFVDYVSAGTELMCTIAIDFTASNGDPRNSDSLHYFNSSMPNQYVQALRAVGEIIQDYDSDKMFPVLGFGARLPPNGVVSHEFFVNFHPNDPHCYGLDGIIASYQNCIAQIQLYGPTNFAPVINHVARFAQATRDGSKYHILLIITDGIITDLPQTRAAVVEASSLPLSIIIVGVGNADFTAMEILDGDDIRLSYNGRYAVRDIVQFVAFRDFHAGLRGDATHAMTQARLAREVLAEIPQQFLSYMKMNRIIPGAQKFTNVRS